MAKLLKALKYTFPPINGRQIVGDFLMEVIAKVPQHVCILDRKISLIKSL